MCGFVSNDRILCVCCQGLCSGDPAQYRENAVDKTKGNPQNVFTIVIDGRDYTYAGSASSASGNDSPVSSEKKTEPEKQIDRDALLRRRQERRIAESGADPEMAETLQESESLLAKHLADDPLNIGQFKATKGLLKGNRSFDDRAYIRFFE